MKNKITINSKDYNLAKAKAVDFNGMCELEEYGLSITDIKRTNLTTIRALLAYVGNITVEQAGTEVMAHLKNGGAIDDFIPLITAFTESDFFQAIRPKEQTVEA